MSRPAPTAGEFARLEVVRLGLFDWRVSQRGAEPADPALLLGYIERLKRDQYEILWMTEPPAWSYVPSFSAALAALSDPMAFTGMRSARRDKAARIAATLPFGPVHRRTKSPA